MRLPSFLAAVLPTLAAADCTPQNHPDFAERNQRTIQSIYNLTIFPNNAAILTNGTSNVPPGLFSANATGRVSPLGNFTGFDDSTEYFFGLTPIPTKENNFAAIFEAQIRSFTSECPDVATSVVVLNVSSIDVNTGMPTGNRTVPLEEIAVWQFDETGAVLRYEAWIPTLQSFVSASELLSGSSTPAQTIQGLCLSIQDECVGANQQYKSVSDCVDMLSAKSFGTYDETWSDSVVCRTIHVLLARLRPDVHCPHCGPNGGDPINGFKCVEIDYSLEYFDDVALFGGDGQPFNCNGESQYKHVRREIGELLA